MEKQDKYFTPQKAFEIPILKILEKNGGEARPSKVYDELEKMMNFTKADWHKMQSGEIKWRNNAAWARKKMCDKGEMDPSVRGRWKITEKGRQRLAKEGPSYDQSKYPPIPGITKRNKSGKTRLMDPESVTTDYLQKWGIKQGLNLLELGLEGVKKKYEDFYRENVAEIRGKYFSLREVLRKVPAETEQVTLEFREIEKIVGDQLPKSARTYTAYWTNTSSPNRLVKAIRDEGWEVEDVFLKAGIVVLRRKDTDPISGMTKYIHYIIENSPKVPKPNQDVLARWIRTCRQLGFYYQGKSLYEKGGLNPEGLSDRDAARVEEDYRVCLKKVYHLQRLDTNN